MKIVVTGGSGRLGQHVISELMADGHDVLSLDRIAPPEALCPSWATDLKESGPVYQALKGAGGVVHLGAYQAPGIAPDCETLSNNVTATYNVLKAAVDMGVSRVVIASSVAAYGFLYASRPWLPDYLPLDEAHPSKPQDPYGLSKVFGEQLADALVSISELRVASLRLAGINFEPSFQGFAERWKDPGVRLGSFWSYVDARDAATSCRLALVATFDGHEIFNVAAPTSSMREPTDELVRRYLPGFTNVKDGLQGNWSGLDAGKVERVLGFRAQHPWERYLSASSFSM